jgi:aldehyde dehydrogenase (NAD+)
VVGERMLQDTRIPLISFTGSTPMGRRVAEKVGARLGRTILELGGNNAAVVMQDANLQLATRAILFGAVGTAGQRCTSTRRVLVHKPIADKLTSRLLDAWKKVRIGNPLHDGTTMGPMVSREAVADMQEALTTIRQQGGEILYGGELLQGSGYEGGCYVRPALVKAKPAMPIVKQETFAPILYVIEVNDLDHAIALHNDVPQGLSSSIFTSSLQAAERFLSAEGSDCGMANVNAGTSGAEIGGAFGGEKETGGGRESGSDAWKQYMRRLTSAINYSDALPLAQGIEFGED